MANVAAEKREEFRADYQTFLDATRQFYTGEMDAKTYKGISGGFGSYAQRGAEHSMLRLRFTGGRVNREALHFLAEAVRRYAVKRVHFTTCQSVQFHDLDKDAVCALALEALEHGIITRGGGGDFPRNVMVSPRSGVEPEEYFDVLPYARAAADYLLGFIHGPKLPRKLKVGFSNSPANLTHATFRDLGFAARSDGRFDVYSAGGLGNNPLFGVKVAEGVLPQDILYYIEAMHRLFLAHGNYENRAKARTRYMQEALGGTENYRKAFLAELEAVRGEEIDLRIPAPQVQSDAVDDGGESRHAMRENTETGAKACAGTKAEVGAQTETKAGAEAVQAQAWAALLQNSRVLPQKQQGLCTVVYHPMGGCPAPGLFEKLEGLLGDMPEVALALAPDESLYFLNCGEQEAKRLLSETQDSAKTAFSASVACIGSSVCQQGLRDSQALLLRLCEMEQAEGFADGVLPKLHISGCPSSCGTHQIGTVGLRGASKKVNGQQREAFQLSFGGRDTQGAERMGEVLGILSEEELVDCFRKLGRMVTESGLSFQAWNEREPEVFRQLAEAYL